MIDLRSDTVTKPNNAMRQAACDAEVGDDVYEDDPTVTELEHRAAGLVGKDAALYVPSGTMGNQIAARVHTKRGQEILCDEQAHVYKSELGGLAQLSELQVRPINCSERCVPTAEQVREGYVQKDLHRPGTGLLSLENTHNSRGGVAVSKEYIDEAAEAAHELEVPVHLDGARLFNAATALDEDAAVLAENVDTVMFSLSKGLGAPVGSLLCGPSKFITRARRTRKLFGGGMRQVGIVAAPGLVALENVGRLEEDHANAKRLSKGVDAIEGLSSPMPDSNIVIVDSFRAGLTAETFVTACKAEGIAGGAVGEHTTRFCTHWNVSADVIEVVLDAIARAVKVT